MLTPEQKIAEHPLLLQRIGALEAQLAWFQKQVFGGGKSEKLEVSTRQLSLSGIEQTKAAIADRTEKIAYERTKTREPRPTPAEVFAHVPVTETLEIVPEAVQRDPEVYERIGEERTFEIDLTPARLVKREIVRPKYRHRLDRTRAPLLAAAPARTVPGGYASAGLIASIVIGKYVDHLPLYRQEQMSARWGATISRRSMCDWVEVAAMWLEPIYRHMHRGLVTGNYLQADETPIRCNDPDHDRGKTLQCYLWVISRPKSDVVFAWRESRRHEELTSLLADFKGVLQSDAYGAYASHERKHEKIVRAGCWAHARRYFHEALDRHRKPAELVLRLIGRLYRLEAKWDEAEVGDRRAALRQEHFVRPLRWLRRIALGLARKALPQSELGKACTYLLNNWDVLVVHQNHSFTRIDNNLVENGTPSSEFHFLLRVSDNSEFALGECGSAECLGALWGVESSGLCDRLKEGEQPRGLVPPDAIRSFGLGESTEALSLHLEIRLDVSVRRHRTGVTQVEGDHFDGDAGLQQCHGAAVSKTMGRYSSTAERWALNSGFAYGQLEPIRDPVVA